MKRHFQLAMAALVVAATTIGCKQKAAGTDLQLATAEKSLSVPLTGSTPTPACSIAVNFIYVDAQDSVAKRINESLTDKLFGYCGLTPQESVDSFTNSYICVYKTEAGLNYRLDNESGGGETDWYNYSYSLNTQQIKDAREGVICFSAERTLFQGGAHGEHDCTYLNFDRQSGALLTLDSLFTPGYKLSLTDILLKALMKEKQVTSLEALKEKGYLQWTDLYPTENFLLGRDTMRFLYNAYEIAPYCEGITTLNIPYTELKGLLKE